mgnify:FL=1
MSKEFDLKFLGKDFSASIVVFLVALPLCLGISLVSEAPLISGLIAGIVGGVVVGSISGSRLGVSGPAAGLAVIVADAIKDIGSFEVFIAAVVIAGVIQVVLGYIGAGKVAFYFPSSVIKGMLAAIGISIFLKQIPHAIGVDKDPNGDFKFFQSDGETTFSELLNFENYVPGALIIGVICLAILIFWESKWIKGNKVLSMVPGPLLAVFAGIGLNQWYPDTLHITKEHLVQIPEIGSLSGLSEYLIHPKLASFAKFKVIKVGVVIAIIASLETLLCVEATDRLDPRKNITPTNRELKAQGFGNIISGLVGGIPVTQVIVRSSANIQAGGRTKLAAILHGVFLFGTVMLIPNLLNMIPLSALAAILLVIGFKLAKPSMFKRLYSEGQDQFIPFITTIVAVLFTDLLIGILIGLLVGIGYVLFTNFRSAIVLEQKGRHMIIHFKKDIFFYNRAELMKLFSKLEEGDELTLDGTKVDFIDHDIFLAIQDFVNLSDEKKIKVTVIDITRKKITFRRNQQESHTLKN